MRQLLDKVVDVPDEVPQFKFSLVGVVDVPVVQIVGLCAPVVEQIVVCQKFAEQLGVDVFFFGVKGVGDVLAGRWSWVLWSSSLESRASLTCLLGVGAGFLWIYSQFQGRL